MFQLEKWHNTPLGALLKAAEQNALAQHLQTLFGYHLLLTGISDINMVESSRIRHRVILTDSHQRPNSGAAIAGRVEALPIMTDSLDVMILFHSLDFSQNPHQVLREAERVLVPEGHIVVLGFNPRSLWGLRRWLPLKRLNTPWEGRFVSMTRLKDWLELLGFDLIASQQLFYRPPVNNETFLRRMGFCEKAGEKFIKLFGAVYLITAKKKVARLTPIKPRWRPKRRVVSGLVDTASSSMSNKSMTKSSKILF